MHTITTTNANTQTYTHSHISQAKQFSSKHKEQLNRVSLRRKQNNKKNYFYFALHNKFVIACAVVIVIPTIATKSS